MSGMLWIWMATPSKNTKSYILPTLKNSHPLEYAFTAYHKEGVIPQINIAPTDVVLALGSGPLQELKKYGLVKKNLTISSASKTPITLTGSGAKCLVSYSPAIRETDYSLYTTLLGDIKLAARLALTGSLVPPPLDFKYVLDFTEVLETINAKKATATHTHVAVDLETTGLVAYDKDTWIVTIQVSTDTTSSRVIYLDKDTQPKKPIDGAITCRAELLWTQINTLLNDPFINLRGANLKYDLMWIAEKWGIFCTNFKMDTLLVGSLLDENRSNSLKTHAHVFTCYGDYELPLYENYDIAKPHEVPKDILLPYCGYDTTVCLEVSHKMVDELLMWPTLKKFYLEILHPAARAYERVERVGITVDVDYYKNPNPDFDVDAYIAEGMAITQEKEEALIKKLGSADFNKQRTELRKTLTQEAEILKYSLQGYLKKKLNETQVAGLALIPGKIKVKHSDNKSLTRAAMLVDLFFKHPLGYKLKPVMTTPKPDKDGNPKISTAMDHFLKFKEDEKAAPIIKLIEDYKDIDKTLGTYVDGFLNHLRDDGKFHGTYYLFKGGDTDNGTDCFPAGELILTNRGYIPIETVEVGDKVITHTGEPKEVYETIDNGIHHIVKVVLSNGLSLSTTKNHPYLLSDGTWVKAEFLTQGMQVQVHSDAEVWKPIIGFPFHISSWGRVRSDKTSRILIQQKKDKYGHLNVTLYRNGAQDRASGDIKDVTIHRLVASAFIPNPLGYKEVRHLNGIVWDNTVSNLAWGSRKDNAEDAVAHGTTRQAWQALASFTTATVVTKTDIPAAATYGISVEGNHSHVSGGVVTHNTGRVSVIGPALQTVPKNTKWAKPLRRALIAPKGYYICEQDYSQGELRIAAELANEPKMLWAYNHDIDLHAVTGASVAGIDLETFMSYKDSDDPHLVKIFKTNRQKAKGCIAEGQLVTTDKGLVPIEQVTKDMKVWDGIDWVTHDGVVYQGEKYVMEYQGLVATPDHVVFTEVGAMPLYMAFENNLKLAHTITATNRHYCFYYGNIDNVTYLKGKLDDSVTTNSIISKAREYGFGDYIFIDRDFTTNCYYRIKWWCTKTLANRWGL